MLVISLAYLPNTKQSFQPREVSSAVVLSSGWISTSPGAELQGAQFLSPVMYSICYHPQCSALQRFLAAVGLPKSTRETASCARAKVIFITYFAMATPHWPWPRPWPNQTVSRTMAVLSSDALSLHTDWQQLDSLLFRCSLSFQVPVFL